MIVEKAKETSSDIGMHNRAIIVLHEQWMCQRHTHITLCSLKPYNIKGKTVTTNAVDSTAVLLSVMITQTISGLEGQCHLSGNCSNAWEIVALLGKL